MDQDELPAEVSDHVPPRLRTVGYFIAVIGGPLIAVVVGIVALWLPGWAQEVNETGVLLSSFLAAVAGGLGYAYRPTKR